MSEYKAIPAFGKFPVWWGPWQHTHKGSESRGSILSGVEHNASQTLDAQQTEQRSHHSEERSGTQASASTYLSGACVPGSGPGSRGSAMVQAGQPGAWDKPQTQPSLCERNSLSPTSSLSPTEVCTPTSLFLHQGFLRLWGVRIAGHSCKCSLELLRI